MQVLDEWVKILNQEQIRLREEVEALKSGYTEVVTYLRQLQKNNELLYKRVFYLEEANLELVKRVKGGVGCR